MPVPVVAVLNLKGGVGKTTLAAHVFKEVFANKRVSILLIDLDPQFNLSQQLLAQSRYNTLQVADKTTLRLFEPAPTSDFFDVNMSAQEPPEPNVLANRLRYLVLDPNKVISLIAGTFELTKFSFIEDHAKLTHARNFFKRSISKARAMYDLVVLDLNPSSSFLTFCGLSVATNVLSPVRPDKFSVLGLSLVKRLIDHQLVNPKPRLHIVMNAVKRSKGITVPEREIRTADYFKDCILVNRVYESGVLVARPDFTGFASERKVSNRHLISTELREVGLELCDRLGI